MDERFELVRPLGKGGQGQVFLVRDCCRQNRLVALKRVGQDEEQRRTLAYEFDRLAGLRHPNLAVAYDFAEDDEGPYFTSEFVDGPDIVTWARNADEDAVVRAMSSILRALALMHDRDLVHGDVSPANVLIASNVSDAGESKPKLLDLGGARRPGQTGAATTAGFAAPEVLTGRGVLTASDLYSFGVLLSTVLYNKNPFGSGKASEIVRCQLSGEVDLPDPSVSPAAGLCLGLVNPDPALRPKSAQETLEQLADATGIDLAVNISQLRGGDLPAPRLVGRRSELAALTAVVDQLDDLNGERVVRIAGPRGSGRSTALAEVVRAAQLSGFFVIGRAGGPVSAVELLGGLIRAAEKDHLSTSTKLTLSPWMEETYTKEAIQSPASWSQSVGFAAVDALVNVCSSRPVLVAIDDLSGCDQLVQEVAATLARALAPSRPSRPAAILVIAGDSAHFEETRQDLAGVQIGLGPLDTGAVGELVSSMLPGVSIPYDLAQTIYLASSGWPGSAEQFVRQAVGPGGGGDLEARTREKVSAAEKETKELLAVLAMVDEPCPAGLLEEIGGNSDRLKSVTETGFLFEVNGPGGPGLQVASAIGLAAKKKVAEKRQAILADKLAKGLARQGRLTQAARLWMRAGDRAAAAEAFGTLARESRKRGDLAGAGQWFKEALDHMEKGSQAGSLAMEAVETWRTIGRFDLALKELGRTEMTNSEKELLEAELTLDQGRHRNALDLARRIENKSINDPALTGVIAAAELQLGLHEQALATVRNGLKDRPPGEPDNKVARLAQIGGLACTYLGHIDEASALFKQAEQYFETTGDLTGRIKVSANQGMLQRRRGDLTGARSLYNRAVALAREVGDRSREGLHLMNRATISTVSGDIAAAHDDYLAALDIAVLLGNDFTRAQVEVNLADQLSGLGDFRAALKMAGNAIERCRILGQERLEARAILTSGVAMLRAGDLKRAEPRLNEARRRFANAGDDVYRIAAELHLAELRLCFKDPGGALSIAKKLLVLAERLGLNSERARALVLVARAMTDKGNAVKEALAHLDKAERLFERESLPDNLWRLKFQRAHILERAGLTEKARQARKAARASLNEMLEKIPKQYRESCVSWGEAAELVSKEPIQNGPAPSDRRTRDLERLMEVNQELTREHDPKRLLLLIMENAVELTGAERGMVVMPRSDGLEPVISHQISEEIDVSFSRSMAEKVVADGRAVLAIDAMGDDRFSEFVSVHTMKLRSILAVPLKIRRRVVGIIYLDSKLRAGVFSDEDRHLLEAFGAQAAISLETARLVSENAKRCEELQKANEEIQSLSMQLEEKLKRNEAKLRRVGALLQKTQTDEAERLKENGIVGRAPAMQQVMRMIDRIALTDVPVYIYGASGTGKELVARAIHAGSERAEHPFVPINCGALPPKLLASELFGHIRGAFTGAVCDRPGLFRLADHGTLFLDEVTDMDPEMQSHLLRVLQDGTFRSLGGNEEISVDVRIISASNRDLEQEVHEKRFREDLFYRLNVVRIDVPPLSDRREDVPLLVDFFAGHHGGDNPPDFSREAMDLLVSADWPGNVRELENEVLRSMTMAEPGRSIRPDDLSPRLCKGRNQAPEAWSSIGTLKERVDSFERIVIQRVLAECGGNATRSAVQLGISRAGLYKKLEKHGLER
ncbi:MAG: GAF domain-containing protein [Proteobacteria bacterium]|nr:GAF domain-containing protein [Pseudomonadota bacterium]